MNFDRLPYLEVTIRCGFSQYHFSAQDGYRNVVHRDDFGLIASVSSNYTCHSFIILLGSCCSGPLCSGVLGGNTLLMKE